jgi:hypothetical protein
MLLFGKVIVDEEVPQSVFCCDLPVCRGACCTIVGGRGAPLLDEEVREVVTAFPAVKPYLTEKALNTIADHGLYEGSAGDFATQCVNDRECVFACFENGIARCSFDRAFGEGKTSWQKPLSCHLFPVRVRKAGADFLYYHKIDECQAGRERGQRQNTALRNFLCEPLVRAYGRDWYDTFTAFCDSNAK